MGRGRSTVQMHHACEMKNLIYSASVTRQPDRQKGGNLAKKGVEMSIPYTYVKLLKLTEMGLSTLVPLYDTLASHYHYEEHIQD